MPLKSDLLGPVLAASSKEIYAFDCETLRFIEASEGALGNLGYSLEELQELTPLDIKPDFTFETFANLVQPLLTGECKSIVFETVHRRRDGSCYPVDVHLEIPSLEAGAFLAILRDATERQRVEERRERRIIHLQAMDRINALIVEVNEIDQLLDRVVAELLELLECDRVQLASLKIDSLEIAVEHEACREAYEWGGSLASLCRWTASSLPSSRWSNVAQHQLS